MNAFEPESNQFSKPSTLVKMVNIIIKKYLFIESLTFHLFNNVTLRHNYEKGFKQFLYETGLNVMAEVNILLLLMVFFE